MPSINRRHGATEVRSTTSPSPSHNQYVDQRRTRHTRELLSAPFLTDPLSRFTVHFDMEPQPCNDMDNPPFPPIRILVRSRDVQAANHAIASGHVLAVLTLVPFGSSSPSTARGPIIISGPRVVHPVLASSASLASQFSTPTVGQLTYDELVMPPPGEYRLRASLLRMADVAAAGPSTFAAAALIGAGFETVTTVESVPFGVGAGWVDGDVDMLTYIAT